MILWFSGYGCKYSDPEIVFKERATVMLTFIDSYNKPKPERRFRKMRKARKQVTK